MVQYNAIRTYGFEVAVADGGLSTMEVLDSSSYVVDLQFKALEVH